MENFELEAEDAVENLRNVYFRLGCHFGRLFIPGRNS